MTAFRDGEHTPAARAGALLCSEFALLIRTFLTAKPKTKK